MKKYKNYLILIILTMGLQALFYYLIKNIVTNYNVINSIIDVPLIKPFVIFYDSWYPVIIICSFLLYKYDKENFKYVICVMLISQFMSQITFIIYPTLINRPTIEVKNIFDLILDITYKSDTPAVNCLPSMHCIYCFIMIYYLLKVKNNKYLKLLPVYLLLIVLSTLFIKQHIIEDVILSLIYTIMAIIIVKHSKPLINKLFKKIKIE